MSFSTFLLNLTSPFLGLMLGIGNLGKIGGGPEWLGPLVSFGISVWGGGLGREGGGLDILWPGGPQEASLEQDLSLLVFCSTIQKHIKAH